MNRILSLFLIFFAVALNSFAQKKPSTLLWEISGKGLNKKSYLFGTNHLFDGTWLDSFTVVKDKLMQSEVVVGEMSIKRRATASPKFSFDTAGAKSFDQLYSKEEYELVDTYGRSIGLSSLDNAPKNDPLIVLRYFFAILGHQTTKQLGIKDNDKSSIDIVIEQIADSSDKRFIGLDHLDSLKGPSKDSVSFFNSDSLAKAMLDMVQDINSGGTKTNAMIGHTQGMFTQWMELKVNYNLKSSDPQKDNPDLKKLNIDRTEKWLKHLPFIIDNNSSFIAVGLAHLKYQEGLISELRKMGYKVKPVPMERKHSL